MGTFAEKKNAIVISRVHSFLPESDVKESRLVCKDWNHPVLSLIPKRFIFNIAKVGKEGIEGKDVTYWLGLLRNLEPSLCRSVAFNHPRGSESAVHIPIQRFLYTFEFYHQLRLMTLRASKSHVAELGKAAVRGLLPNLEELLLDNSDAAENSAPLPPLEPDSFPQLRTLLMSKFPKTSVGSTDHTFWQSVINAAPNIFQLRLYATFDLAKLRKLQILHQMSKGLTSYEKYNEELEEMLQAVSNSLTELKVKVYRNVVEATFPFLPKLTKFVFTTSVDIKLENVLPHIGSRFPNLQELKVRVGFIHEATLKQFLGVVKRSFKLLKIIVDHPIVFGRPLGKKSDKALQEWVDCWTASLSEVETLWFVCPSKMDVAFGSNHSDLALATEEWVDGLVNLQFRPNRLVIEFVDKLKLSVLMKLLHLSQNELNKEAEARGVLEIHNGCRNETYATANAERGRDVQRFPIVIKQLLQKWKKVCFHRFKVPEKHMEMIFEGMRHSDYAIEFFSYQ